MIALPPFNPDVNETAIDAVDVVVEPDNAFTPVGALGTVAGTNAFDGLDGGPVPTPFVAVTVHV